MFTQFKNSSTSSYYKLLTYTKLTTPEEQAFPNELQEIINKYPNQVQIYPKTTYSLFNSTAIVSLPEQGSKIYMCGMDTDGCVLLSAMDAFEFGYVPVVFGDLCMSSGGQAFHTSAIHILKRSLGRRNVVLSTSISLTQKKLRAFLKFLYSLFS